MCFKKEIITFFIKLTPICTKSLHLPQEMIVIYQDVLEPAVQNYASFHFIILSPYLLNSSKFFPCNKQ